MNTDFRGTQISGLYSIDFCVDVSTTIQVYYRSITCTLQLSLRLIEAESDCGIGTQPSRVPLSVLRNLNILSGLFY
jgi:hypothetical protein